MPYTQRTIRYFLALVLTLLVLLIGASRARAFEQPRQPQPNAASNAILQLENVAIMDQTLFGGSPYFGGEVYAYSQIIPYVESEGMTFVTNYNVKVDEEDQILSLVVQAEVAMYMTNAQTQQFYQGMIAGAYSALYVLNNWPGSGPAVLGTY
jgi:hypothetical protein